MFKNTEKYCDKDLNFNESESKEKDESLWNEEEELHEKNDGKDAEIKFEYY